MSMYMRGRLKRRWMKRGNLFHEVLAMGIFFGYGNYNKVRS